MPIDKTFPASLFPCSCPASCDSRTGPPGRDVEHERLPLQVRKIDARLQPCGSARKDEDVVICLLSIDSHRRISHGVGAKRPGLR